MRVLFFLLAITVLSGSMSSAQHSVTFEKRDFTLQHNVLPYRILYPQEYDAGKHYPLVVFLHGSGARGNDNESQLSNLPGIFVDAENRTNFPCFVVAPQCPENDTWVNFPGFPESLKATDTPTIPGRMVLELIADLARKLNIDTRRIYLTGYSMGGEGTFDLITRQPDLFAAAVPVCPVADTSKAALIKDNDIWVFHGADDKVNEVKYSRLMIDALRWQGADPAYTEYPGVGHRCWTKAYNDPDLLPWMFSHIKTDHPNGDNEHVLTLQDTLLGSVTPERRWWDVLHYDLQIQPYFDTRRMSGSNCITYKVVDTGSGLMQIDLQQPLIIDSVILDKNTSLSFSNKQHVWYLSMPGQHIGTEHTVTIYYSGIPHVARFPPWHGGMTWTRDSLNRPWIATSCQLTGASIWYPCKNHQSDEPDRGATIAITVPDTLVAVSNGRLRSKLTGNGHKVTYIWKVVNPVNNYGLCFYVGKYVNITEPFKGIAGDLPLNFWVLDYNVEKARQYMVPNTRQTIQAMEYWLGPYPFYEDGVKLVDAPYIGMEHQSAVAYGNRYKYGYKGKDISGTGWGLKYDIILVHELAHEWFGNSITTEDLADKWVHEGFTGYAEILYLEQWSGRQAAHEYMIAKRRNISNKHPVIARYNIDEASGGDDYAKGRAIIHMIRSVMNDDQQFRQLMLDMNKKFYHRVTTSKAVEEFISQATGIDFSKMFEHYLHTTQVPVLEYMIEGDSLRYRYSNCIQGFTMPVKVHFKREQWLNPTTGWQSIYFKGLTGKEVLDVDPDFYVTAKKVK